jgi:hypothetical protein
MPFSDCCLLPCLEGFLASEHSVVEVLRGGNWGIPEILLSSGVGDLVLFLCWAGLSTYDVEELEFWLICLNGRRHIGLVYFNQSN